MVSHTTIVQTWHTLAQVCPGEQARKITSAAPRTQAESFMRPRHVTILRLAPLGRSVPFDFFLTVNVYPFDNLKVKEGLPWWRSG